MSKLTNLLGAASLAVIAGATSGAAETVLTLNSWLPPSHPQVSELVLPFAAEIEEVTEGRVKVTVLPAPMGPPPATYDLVKNGVVDIGYTVQGYTPGRFKTSAVAEMPFLTSDAVVSSVAYQRVHDAMLAEAGEYEGVKVLAVHTHGPGQIFSSSMIESVDDIQGQKIRVGSIVAHDLAKLLGAVPVEGPSSKAYELLSQKVADGIFFPWETVNFFSLGDIVKSAFVAEGGVYNTAFMMVMNQAKWDSISPEDQAAIETIIGEPLVRKAGEMWNAADAAGRASLEGSLAIYDASEDDIAALRERFAPVVEANIALVSEAGVDGQAAYEMLLSEIEKLEAE
ncbi:TRAP transporter substrate-binding protein [Litorisediminicola beolgyonensis]|uniref:TRAP transporter substrate-binding protein n=1 Tax=Litorisediminicola beolgyonensis TaxID=1173614 RepID=A0ABW3ZLX9_9RHOB